MTASISSMVNFRKPPSFVTCKPTRAAVSNGKPWGCWNATASAQVLITATCTHVVRCRAHACKAMGAHRCNLDIGAADLLLHHLLQCLHRQRLCSRQRHRRPSPILQNSPGTSACCHWISCSYSGTSQVQPPRSMTHRHCLLQIRLRPLAAAPNRLGLEAHEGTRRVGVVQHRPVPLVHARNEQSDTIRPALRAQDTCVRKAVYSRRPTATKRRSE